MSDYVRIKAVRYKFNNDILKGLDKEIEERDFLGTPVELYNEKHNLPDYFDHKLNDFTANSGWDFDKKEEHLFLDYLLDYEYGASGDFESVRELTKTEFEKYKEIFKDILPDLKPGELRLVHYSYYNGVDEPSVWNLEEI